VTGSATTADWPGARSAGSDARAPSHTIIAPAAVSQCEARCTGVGPAALQVRVPVFVTETLNVLGPNVNAEAAAAAGA